MKKLTVYAAAAIIAMTSASAMTSQAAVKTYIVTGNGNLQTQGILTSGGSCGGFLRPGNGFQGNWNSCFGIMRQGSSKPCWGNIYQDGSCGGICQSSPCDNEIIIPGICQPDINQPGTSQPDISQPDINQPETSQPDVNQPETSQPETESPDQSRQSYIQQIITLVNEERAKAGLSPVTEAKNVSQAAALRAQEISRSFSHTRPDGSSFSTALTQSGVSYQGSGENIASGYSTPEAVMNGWMNSQGHRANILNPSYTTIGVGYYQSGGTGYWTQLFTY